MFPCQISFFRLEGEAHHRWEQRNAFAKLINAVGNCITAHTDMLCYFLAILAHAICAGIITLPYPLLVFLWGSLASPRPSRLFWIVMIAYTEFVIVFKYIFQFGFFPWNKPEFEVKSVNNAYRLDYLFGVQKINYFAMMDVALLIALFFHRYNLRRLGLWKDANVSETFSEDPSTTTTTANSPEANATVRIEEVTIFKRGMLLVELLCRLLPPWQLRLD